MTGWKTYRLGEIVATNKKSIGRSYPFSMIKYLDTGSITRNHIESLQEYKLSEAPSRAKRLVQEGDIIYSAVRPNQLHYGYISKFPENLVVSTGFIVISCNKDYIEPKFLYYLLTQQEMTDYLHSIADASTSAYPSLKSSDIENLEISLPPLEEQRRIAGILGAIDDKIENNRRINTNLELQAQALYKQWFVDNRSDNWEEIKLGDIIEISKKSITPSQFENTIFEHYSLPAYDDGKQPTFDRGQDIKSSKFVINNGMFLFSKLNPYIKRIWFPNIGTEHAICSTEFIPYKPKRVDMLGLCYSIVNSEHFYDYVLSLTNGSTGSHQRFHPVDTLEYPLCIPSEKYIEKFESLVMPMYKEIALNRKENRRLATLRDTLLPKLMNNEISL